MLFCVGIALLGCKKDTAVAVPEPENQFVVMLRKWRYVETKNKPTGDRTIEHPNLEIEFFKDFTFKHYVDGKVIRTGKYLMLDSFKDNNYSDPYQQLKYTNTNEIVVIKAYSGYNSTKRIDQNYFYIPKGIRGSISDIMEEYEEVK